MCYDDFDVNFQGGKWRESRKRAPKQGGNAGKTKEICTEKRKEGEKGGRFPDLERARNPKEKISGKLQTSLG